MLSNIQFEKLYCSAIQTSSKYKVECFKMDSDDGSDNALIDDSDSEIRRL